tara:strand:+ start:178 stop:792 length:615 start_codon:yes stop_codon:yes gene_type:complete
MIQEKGMGKTLNELTGPQVFVYKNPRSKVYHLTGGYNQPDVKKAFCGTAIKVQNVIDARDIAPREGFRDSSLWCKRCLAMLDFEGLDQKVLFSAIKFGPGTYGQLVVAPHVGRKKPQLNLSPPPAKPQKYTLAEAATDAIVTSRKRKKTATKPSKKPTTGGATIKAPARRRPKKVDKGDNDKNNIDVDVQTVADSGSDANNGVE